MGLVAACDLGLEGVLSGLILSQLIIQVVSSEGSHQGPCKSFWTIAMRDLGSMRFPKKGCLVADGRKMVLARNARRGIKAMGNERPLLCQ